MKVERKYKIKKGKINILENRHCMMKLWVRKAFAIVLFVGSLEEKRALIRGPKVKTVDMWA